jgi:hypothetical protein
LLFGLAWIPAHFVSSESIILNPIILGSPESQFWDKDLYMYVIHLRGQKGVRGGRESKTEEEKPHEAPLSRKLLGT